MATCCEFHAGMRGQTMTTFEGVPERLEKGVKSKTAIIYLSRASRSILRVRIEDPM